jgi:hypothetical protein
MAEGTIVQFLLSQVRTSETSLVGGTAYFYAIGGTTPKAIYSDMAATTAIYSVVLDADGTAEVYGTGKYRVIIKDADGVTQFDRDVNFWGGSGYTIAPATNTDHFVPRWSGTDSATLENGYEIVTTIDATGSDSKLATEQAVREAITGVVASASTTYEGIVKLSTNAIGLAATDTTKAITPAVLDYVIDNTPHVLQVVNYTSNSFTSTTNPIPIDNTIPQKTEGAEWGTLAITPKNATSKLIIDVKLNTETPGIAVVALFQDTDSSALSATIIAYARTAHIKHFMVSGTTSEIIFKVRYGTVSGYTCGINSCGYATTLGGVFNSSITITEVLV